MAEPIKNVCAVCGRAPPEGALACPYDGNTSFIEGPAPDPLLNQQLGDYTVLEAIGEGGMGLVYRGIQPVIKKKVAIKVLRAEFASDPVQVKRLLKEAEAVNSISHRNIIDIFGLGQLPDGRHYIVMEFLEGTPLDQYLRKTAPLPALEVVELLIDVCGPLFAAHTAGVIHRDLKPSNVFLVQQPDGTRYLKLLDFGLAKKGTTIDGRTSHTSMTLISGTPDYMAPEQCRGLDMSPRTDLYALGVMAWEMLTGRIPFTGKTPMDVMMQQVSEPAIAPSSMQRGVPPELDALVLWLMQKAPEARPASAEVVRNELKRIGLELRGLAGAATTRAWTGEMPAYKPGQLAAPARASPPVRGPAPAAAPQREPEEPAPAPRRFGLLAALAVTALVAAGGGWWWVGGTDEPAPVLAPIAPPILVEPPPPDPAAPVLAPVELPVEPPPPEPAKPSTGRPRARDNVPSAADLTRRVKLLEKKLRTKGEGEADPSALQLLDKQRLRATMSLSPVERREVSKKLDSWERTFLKN